MSMREWSFRFLISFVEKILSASSLCETASYFVLKDG